MDDMKDEVKRLLAECMADCAQSYSIGNYSAQKLNNPMSGPVRY